MLRRVQAEATFDGHEAVRYGDRVYVVSTGSGAINVYDVGSLALVRRHALWRRRDHINTVRSSARRDAESLLRRPRYEMRTERQRGVVRRPATR